MTTPPAGASSTIAPVASQPPASVPFSAAFRFWLKLGFINFGGPTGQIAVMHQALVEERRWISERRFLHALNYCMLLPGPEAQQLAVYVGWLLHRTLGGLIAGLLFILPGAAVMLALSWIHAEHGDVGSIAASLDGLRAAVIAIVAMAVIRIGAKALKNPVHWAIAAASFSALFFFAIPFPAVIVGAGLLGLLGGRRWPRLFATTAGHGGGASSGVVLHDDEPPPEHARPTLARLLRCFAIGLTIWIVPLLLVAWWRGREDVLTQEAIFFSKCALVTFGGAYAVLAYISQAAVEHFGWVTAPQMLDGLGLAESTPGPLILVTQFVGFLGAHGRASDLSPGTMGVLGSLVTLWATFAPCFLWIFAGAPWIERLRGERLLGAALTAITAAVVGVILNLSVWLGLHTLFATTSERRFGLVRVLVPDLRTIDPFALLVAIAAFVAMKRFKVGIIPVVLGGALAGLIWKGWLHA